MKKTIALLLLLSILLGLLTALPSAADERIILTIGDISDRTSSRMDGEDQLWLWKYLEDQLGVEIQFVHLSAEEYATGLSSGNLPDIVATDNNLATILDSGVALNAEPYLEEYVPNLLTGDARLAYDVFKQLLGDGEGFYFFPQKIGYNGVGYSNSAYNRGYIVRWDYYKELGYPPINNEEDYLNVLLQMHANHPYTEEGYPTYLYGATNFKGYATAFRSELSLDYWAAYKYQNNIFTNEIFDGYTVYTDGVPEATDANGELFGTERMVEALNTCAEESPEEILRRVRIAVDAFVGDAEQFDDLTMLCIEYHGKEE